MELPGEDWRATATATATATAAAVVEEYSPRCSRTSCTARFLSAGSIFFGMAPSSVTCKKAAQNRGRFSVELTRPQPIVKSSSHVASFL